MKPVLIGTAVGVTVFIGLNVVAGLIIRNVFRKMATEWATASSTL